MRSSPTAASGSSTRRLTGRRRAGAGPRRDRGGRAAARPSQPRLRGDRVAARVPHLTVSDSVPDSPFEGAGRALAEVGGERALVAGAACPDRRGGGRHRALFTLGKGASACTRCLPMPPRKALGGFAPDHLLVGQVRPWTATPPGTGCAARWIARGGICPGSSSSSEDAPLVVLTADRVDGPRRCPRILSMMVDSGSRSCGSP